MAEENFVGGLFVSRREGSPDFVKVSLSFSRDAFVSYLVAHANEKNYMNVDILESKGGKLYAKLNNYKPTEIKVEQKEEVVEEIKVDKIPF